MSVSTTKYIVPRDDNTSLVSPLSDSWRDLLQRNVEAARSYDRWILEIKAKARSEVLEILGGNQWDGPIVLGGHQPEFFHAGVWFKNFFLNRLANSLQGTPVHVQIDHDIVRDIELSVPTIRSERLTLSTRRLPTSREGRFLPWENTRCSDSLNEEWIQAISQIQNDLHPLGVRSLIETRRSELERLLQECKSFAQVTSRFRQIIEEDAGLKNFEIPMSRLANGIAFAEFVFRCVNDGERLLDVYNSSRDDFRDERGISNPGQPVPALRRVGDWIETPFWIYHTTETSQSLGTNSHYRQAAWIRIKSNLVELTNSPTESPTIRVVFDRTLADWQQQTRLSVGHGVCIRPRALMTTLFLRLMVGDLFVHGIGGGIYDELTDLIARRMWGVEMPSFIVASASLHLPFVEDVVRRIRPIEGPSQVELQQRAHRLRSAPESFLDLADPEQRAQAEAFVELLGRMPPKGQRKTWHWEMRGLRSRIRDSVVGIANQLERQSLELIERARMSKITRSREYSFVLFPEISAVERLRALVQRSVCTECSSHESGRKLKDGETSTLAAEEC